MKKIICLFIVSLAFLTNVQADIQEDTYYTTETSCCFEKKIYAKIFYGTDFTKYNLESRMGAKTLGSALSFAIGYSFNPTLSVEAEYSCRENYYPVLYQNNNGRRSYYYMEQRASSYMVNVIKDFKLCTVKCVEINLLLGLGAGCDYRIFRGAGFSWQCITGLNFPIACNITLSLEYRLHQGLFSCSRYNHAIGLGLTYKFN